MRKILLSQMFCIIVEILFCFQCYAQTISSSELINNAKQYDAKIVTCRGEVIGDIMVRGEHAWLSVNDGSVAVGIWTDKASIKNIQYVGDYKTKGDVIEVVGVFNRSCPGHGGDLDIHAQFINKISSGNKVSHALNTRAIKFALGLFCIVLLFFFMKVR